MSAAPVTNPLLAGGTKKRSDLEFRVYQNLKIGIHRELLKHIDLEKMATQPDDQTRRQVYA
jgi:hypothetical protein